MTRFSLPGFNAERESKKWKRHVEKFKPYELPRIALILLYLTRMAELLGAVELNVLLASDKEALDFRTMQMAQCSMTGVAAALIAQVANSTLQLQYMPTIHWIVPALCTSSLVISLLCVYYSFRMHYLLARFTSAYHLRAAFIWSAPKGNEGGDERRERGGCGEGREGTGVETLGQVEEGRWTMLVSYQATFILWLPFSLLRLAIFLYLVVLASYWGVAAKMDLQESRARSTNVFVFTLLALSIVIYQRFLGTRRLRN